MAAATSATPATSSDPRVEYLDFQFSDAMPAADIVSLLDKTVNAAAVTSSSPVALRRGYYVTATPRGSNAILELDADAAGVRPSQAYVQVAVPNDLGAVFRDLVQVSMATQALTALTPGLSQPWNLYLHAESPTGGTLEIGVAGDANARFTLSWKLSSPSRRINAFAPPAAFPGATVKLGGTVYFPIGEPTFKAQVNRAYGYNAPQRFNDFPLVPHAWLHLTVTADATGTVVNVHFDAITTSGARLFVAEAPASTDVGGRFFDETVARMEQMTAEEAALPGSSKPWGTSYYYRDPAKGVVDVVVKGEKGDFVIAYAVETPVYQVSP